MEDQEYAGFWIRAGATIIDSIIVGLITLPIIIGIYGEEVLEDDIFVHGVWDFVISYVLPAIGIILFWFYKLFFRFLNSRILEFA